MSEVVKKRRRAPARTVEQDENEMIALAVNCARKALENGTASPAVITHYLRLGTEKAKLERERLYAQTQLDRAKVSQIQAQDDLKVLFENAISAMTEYSGGDTSYGH